MCYEIELNMTFKTGCLHFHELKISNFALCENISLLTSYNAEKDKLNLVKIGHGGLVLDLSQFFDTQTWCSIQKWSKETKK